MTRSVFYSAFVAILLAGASQAGFVVDKACPTSVSDGYREAMAMANAASLALSKKDPRDAGDKGLFTVLFDELDRTYVKGIYDKIKLLSADTANTIRFFCNEDTIHWPAGADKTTDKTSMFYHSGFLDSANAAVNQDLGVESNVALPRKTGCEQGSLAYTINGLDSESKQISIILCPSVLGTSGTMDRRPATVIKRDGLQAKFNSLQSIDPLSKTILHELTHSTPVGGINPVTLQSIILDGPNGDSYGFTKCRELKKSDSRAPAKNADSYAEVALGLFLQFPAKFPQFTWGLGAVNVGGTRDHQPYVPPRNPTGPTPKRDDAAGPWPQERRELINDYESLASKGWKKWTA